MAEVQRVLPAETREKINSGEGLLVCAYSDPERCKQLPIQGALNLQELESRLTTLPKDQEIIFYCD